MVEAVILLIILHGMIFYLSDRSYVPNETKVVNVKVFIMIKQHYDD